MHEPERLPIPWPEPAATVPEPEPQTPPPARSGHAAWLIPLLAGMLGALVAVAVVLVAGIGRSTEPGTDRITEIVRTEIVTPENVTVDTQAAAVARLVTPSVVRVELFTGATLVGSGSGVVIDADRGYIATNEHVVKTNSTVGIVLSDGRRYDGRVLGVDKLTDLAVVEIEADGLIEIERGSTEDLEVGDTAIVVGNPLGLLGGPTVTVGVLSAFDRLVEGDTSSENLYGMVQTDAPFTRGSSGGALVDAAGRLIGITTAVGVSDLGPEGLGFATPVEVMNRVTADIISNGASEHAFLGIVGQTQLAAQADGGRAPVGVLVSDLVAESSAAASGIEIGDIITTVHGRQVNTMEGLISALRRFGPGDEVEVFVQRGSETLAVTMELGVRAEDL
ncbi:MAG: PDZ domain-containing protein [Acidimicrobiia bacterium]|nr:S1C family serine protease [Acidimicrobiia bacterium]MBT8215262.1 S1C family serine protease [Acidimicrobiia bacterium]NNF10828.1 PDZ domain-containing protein [Acidimicrobiia bacterium]NNL70653.1 PDZ domain-containing protein [Acidimicrobiia bacterium]